MRQNCQQCSANFEITDEDLALYDAVAPVIGGKTYSLPPPTRCPDCRKRRRLAFRNERKLYHRACDLCKKAIVSIYSPDKQLVVYCPDCWWGDQWDQNASGREFDFNRPFFEQFAEVQRRAPLISNIVINSTNCDFNVFCINSKDCYLCSRVEAEHVYYSYLLIGCLWCVDCAYVIRSQYCYQCIDCWDCYTVAFSRLCRNTSDSSFCFDCIGCKHCFGCTGLRNAEYHWFNQRCTPDEYKAKLASYQSGSFAAVAAMRQVFEKQLLTHPRKFALIDRSEQANGDCISASKDVQNSFDIEESETVRHSWGVEYSKTVVDSDFIFHGERCYEQMSNANSSSILFTFGAYDGHDLLYCMLGFAGTHDCFGCISTKRRSYCILNKQYTKDEYERLVPKIIEHLKHHGEYGEFFPGSLSLFGYNESIAQESFPLDRAGAKAQGFHWSSFEPQKPQTTRSLPAAQLPDDIDDVPEDVLQWGITCEVSGKPFKIVKQELDFYRRQRLPLPRRHPDRRHADRIVQRNPRKLWKRNCMQCSVEIETSFAPERPEIVYCEKCYLETVY